MRDVKSVTDLATHRREEYQGSLMACANKEAAAAVRGVKSRTRVERDTGKDADSSRGVHGTVFTTWRGAV